MQNSLEKIRKALESFNNPFIDRKNRPMSPEEYNNHL